MAMENGKCKRWWRSVSREQECFSGETNSLHADFYKSDYLCSTPNETHVSKIVIIGPAHPLRGGIAALNERLTQALQDEGHQVIIYSFSLQYPKFLYPGKTQYTDDPPPPGMEIRTRINSVNPFNWVSVGKEIRRENPDLVLVRFWLPFMGPALGTILRRVRKNRKTRVICIADNIIPHEKRPGDRPFTRYFLKPVQGLLAMSRSVLQDLDQFDRSKPRIFSPHPVYDIYGDQMDKAAARKALSLDPDEPFILFFGFIRDYKGLDLLLEAMGDERLQQMGLKLIVAGEYFSDPAPYEAIIDRLNLKDRIIKTEGFIPNYAVGQYFCAADMVVQPYRSATQSGVTQIAYHFDKPMLVTDVGGLPEIVPHEKAGYVVPVNAAAIADALHDFYSRQREEEFRGHVREEKKRFQWDHFVAQIFSLSDEIGGKA
jgi:D-inositol-3-phosphate glycosyltransferase